MAPSIKYQLLLVTSVIFLLTNVLWTTIAHYYGLTETDNLWVSILILIPDAGPLIWFAIMAIVGIKLVSPKSERPSSSWSHRQLEDRKALFTSVCISNLMLSWALITWGFSFQKYFLNPAAKFQWNPRSPKMSLFFFLARCAMVLGLGVLFYGFAFAVAGMGPSEWDKVTKVKESVKADVDEEKMEDKSCVDTTWEERLKARLEERQELGDRRRSF